jgi:hypothetical protein
VKPFLKYEISYKTKFGTISAESDYPDDLIVGYQTLKQLALKLVEISRNGISREGDRSNKLTSQGRRRGAPISVKGPSRRKARISGSRGQGETTNILREIESNLLSTAFFSKAKSTGETKEKLDSISRNDFTSRKVSQALGILWKKGGLKRSGSRNYYVYSKR